MSTDRPLSSSAHTVDDFDARAATWDDDPTKVAVLMDISDMDAVMSYMQTQDAADAMAHDGVLPETLVFLVEQTR